MNNSTPFSTSVTYFDHNIRTEEISGDLPLNVLFDTVNGMGKTDAPVGLRLEDLGVDILRLIVRHLDVASLARLERTSKSFQCFAHTQGWHVLAGHGQRKYIVGDPGTSKDFVSIDCAWATRTFRRSQGVLPPPPSMGGRGQEGVVAPLSTLLLTVHGLFLVLRSEMRFWSSEQLAAHQPLRTGQLINLANPAGLDVHWKDDVASSADGLPATSALWDITSCTQLDESGCLLALGRANGLIEVISVHKTRPSAHVSVNLVWVFSRMLGKASVQAMHACAHGHLLVAVYKEGHVMCFSTERMVSKRAHGVLVSSWTLGCRLWSVHLGGGDDMHKQAQWLAVGTSTDNIVVYRVENQLPTASVRLDCHGSAVYALESARLDGRSTSGNVHILFAGCFDGILRQFDVRRALQEGHKEALRIFRDRFDTSAIYCLAYGVGAGGNHIAAGTARHGMVKVFDPWNISTRSLREAQGWSMYAAQASKSPTYSLAAQHDRIFGVTDSKLWQIDLRRQSVFAERESPETTIAFYRHFDMILDSSRPV